MYYAMIFTLFVLIFNLTMLGYRNAPLVSPDQCFTLNSIIGSIFILY